MRMIAAVVIIDNDISSIIYAFYATHWVLKSLPVALHLIERVQLASLPKASEMAMIALQSVGSVYFTAAYGVE